MKGYKFICFIFAILTALAQSSIARAETLVEGFENADHLFIPVGQDPLLFTLKASNTSFGTTVTKTQGATLGLLIGGNTPMANGDNLASFVFINRAISLHNQYVAFDWFFSNRDSTRNDSFGFILGGQTGMFYSLADGNSLEFHGSTNIRTTLIDFSGSWNLQPNYIGFGCVNGGGIFGGLSYCGIDNVRILDFIPTLAENNGIPITTSIAGIPLAVTPAVPEPGTWAMLFAGLGLMTVLAWRRRQVVFARAH